MKPSRTDEDAVVDLLDVLLRDGVVVEADVIVSVADIPLVGVKLRAAVAGMTTMTEYGMFESFDRARRARAMEGDVQREPVSRVDGEIPDEREGGEGGLDVAQEPGGGANGDVGQEVGGNANREVIDETDDAAEST